MKLVADIHNFWRWWSVQLGLLAGAFGAAATAYAGMLVLVPQWGNQMPSWFGLVVCGGSSACAFAGVLARRWAQDGLTPAAPTVTTPANQDKPL